MSPSYSKNKKAFHDYMVQDEYEAGVILNGSEVKSIKNGQVNLKGSYVEIINEEAFLRDAHVSRYAQTSEKAFEPTRKRKLILHKKEILKIEEKISQAGVTAIPLELYSKQGLIKLKVGICKGKKLHDKRETLKKKSQDMEIRKELKKLR